MKPALFCLLTLPSAACLCLLTATNAAAHVGAVGPAFADQNAVIKFTVGHGCEGADTYRIEIQIPDEIATLRALPGPFGEATLSRTSSTAPVTAVTWSKPNVQPTDDQYYELAIRFRVPNAPFTTLYFPVIQTCRTAGGEERVSEWTALPGEMGEPAAALLILPPRKPGWNKYTVPAAIADLKIFDDAEIVWAGEAAYSGNPTTKELIAAEAGVEELAEIRAGAEIWVKY